MVFIIGHCWNLKTVNLRSSWMHLANSDPIKGVSDKTVVVTAVTVLRVVAGGVISVRI